MSKCIKQDAMPDVGNPDQEEIRMSDKGLIHIYCGDGKGKTTAALGLVVRALGNNYKVVIVQFFKSWNTGEISTLQKLDNISFIRCNVPAVFSWELKDEQIAPLIEEHNSVFLQVISQCKCNDNGKILIVFDELIGTYNENFIDNEMVLNFLKNKPANIEVVLTGRNPRQELLDIADYVSEIKKVKHPFDKGIKARKGVEY